MINIPNTDVSAFDCEGSYSLSEEFVVNNNFSVLMAIYRHEKACYFKESLESIEAQSLQPNEVVIVIDGPITEELNKVLDFFESRLNIVKVVNPLNKGLSYSLNKGLLVCSNELVIRFDSDDICLDDRFLIQVSFMKSHSRVDISGGWAKTINFLGEEVGNRTVPVSSLDIQKTIWTCPIIHPSVIFRKSKILGIGNYCLEVPNRQEDYELWIRALRNGLVIKNISKYLIKYRIASNPTIKNDFNVAVNRIRVGFSAIHEFGCTPLAYLGLFYPLARIFLPIAVSDWISNKFDPR